LLRNFDNLQKTFCNKYRKTKELKDKQKYKEITRYSFADYLEDYERPQYALYYKKDEQKLISCLEKFFKEYVNMPYKIKGCCPPPMALYLFQAVVLMLTYLHMAISHVMTMLPSLEDTFIYLDGLDKIEDFHTKKSFGTLKKEYPYKIFHA